MQLTIGKKIATAFAVLGVIIAIAGSTVFVSVIKLENMTETISGTSLQTLNTTLSLSIDIEREAHLINTLTQSSLITQKTEHIISNLESLTVSTHESLKLLARSNSYTSKIKQKLGHVTERYESTRDNLLKTHKMVLAGELTESELNKAKNHFQVASNEISQLIADLGKSAQKKMALQTDNVDSEISFVMLATVLVTTVAIIGSTMVGLYISRMIAKPVVQAANTMQDIAMGEGDLTVKLPVVGNDENAEMATNFNAFVDKIRDTILSVTSVSEQISASAQQMSSISEQSNQNIDKQHRETEQVATAMNEMAATIREVAQNAAQAAESGDQAQKKSEDGKRVVTEVTASISDLALEIEAASEVISTLARESEEIGTILDVIKDVAEQTNLLALNAAIEAARAGEQGRGFAVVADEVRTLAGRTQQSTLEIQEMIERLQNGSKKAVDAMTNGQAKVDVSVEKSNEAGHVLDDIAVAVATMNDMSTQIACASEEQGAVADEVNRNIISVNEISSLTSESANETAVASEHLSSLSQDLAQTINTFKI